MNDFIKKAWSDIFSRQKNLELYIVLLVIIIIFFADIFGVDTETAYSEILLAALAILIYGMIESRHYNERVEKSLAEQSNTLSIFERKISQVSQAIAHFNRANSYVSFLNGLNFANESIDIISYVNLRAADAKRTQYYDALYLAIKKRHISHQRIIWNLDQLLWLKQMLSMGWDDLPEFSVKFYRVNPSDNPITTFDLIDQKTVFFGQGWLMEGHVEIASPDVGQYFRSYFAGIWSKCKTIKERGKPADKVILEKLIQEYLTNG